MARRRDDRPVAEHERPELSSEWKQSVRRRLRTWYARHARPLPWRRNRDPYHVWVSEVMLQQTQVATVESYFERFLRAFPTVEALAAADEEQVLRLWEGLGYYRRARQLHAAAQVVAERYEGNFPRDADAVRELPGIGRYTAGAILSIAFDQREPILEANSLRLLARLLGYDGEVTRAAGQRLLWQTAADLLPRSDAGSFNQAMMELGSQVCTPRRPDCDRCPLHSLCEAHRTGREEEIPRTPPRPEMTEVREAAVVVRRRGRVLLVRCREGERWAGLWDFPRFPLEASTGAALRRALVAGVEARTGIRVEPREHLQTLRHGVTRYRITLHCHAARYLSGAPRRCDPQAMRWLPPGELEEVPLSTTGRRLGRLVARA